MMMRVTVLQGWTASGVTSYLDSILRSCRSARQHLAWGTDAVLSCAQSRLCSCGWLRVDLTIHHSCRLLALLRLDLLGSEESAALAARTGTSVAVAGFMEVWLASG